MRDRIVSLAVMVAPNGLVCADLDSFRILASTVLAGSHLQKNNQMQ